MSDDERRKRREQRQGGVASEDPALGEWLLQLWAHGNPPSRIELWQDFGRNRPTRGEMIFHRDFKADAKLGPEECNRLANELHAAAQNDVDVAQKQRIFQVAIIDKDRKSAPLTRRLGPVGPKRTYLAHARPPGGDEDEGDDELDGKGLNYKYIKTLLEELRWDKQRYDTVIGGVLNLLKDALEKKQVENEALMARHMGFFDELERQRDLSLDREVAREWNKLKVSLAHDGVRTVRSIFPRLIADAPEGGRVDRIAKSLGVSPERALVDAFVRDCESTGISERMFGELEQRDGKVVAVAGKEGIFAPEQLLVLLKVRAGALGPDALDDLMPWAAGPLAITEDQMARATPLMTPGTAEALLQLADLRKRAATAKSSNSQEVKQEST